MKKVIIILMLLFSLTACSLKENAMNIVNEAKEELKEDLQELQESDNSNADKKISVENIVIEALENKDAEAIKNLFSEKALSLTEDIDEGIDYMLSIYEGDFVEITQRNQSFTSHSGEKMSCEVHPVCVFKTTKNYYKLTWDEWTVQEKEPERLGVYSMRLEVWPDAGLNQGGGCSNILGILYPKNEMIYDTKSVILKFLHTKDMDKDMYEYECQKYREDFYNILSDKLLSISDIDNKIDAFLESIPVDITGSIGDGWIEYDNEKTNVYVEIGSKAVNKYVLYFSFDSEQADKISTLKVTKIEEGKTISDYNLKADEAGIYLPS